MPNRGTVVLNAPFSNSLKDLGPYGHQESNPHGGVIGNDALILDGVNDHVKFDGDKGEGDYRGEGDLLIAASICPTPGETSGYIVSKIWNLGGIGVNYALHIERAAQGGTYVCVSLGDNASNPSTGKHVQTDHPCVVAGRWHHIVAHVRGADRSIHLTVRWDGGRDGAVANHTITAWPPAWQQNDRRPFLIGAYDPNVNAPTPAQSANQFRGMIRDVLVLRF